MKKEFDFDDIGKKTPYRVPEGFFEEMQQVSGTSFMDNRFYGCRHSCGISWLSVYTVPFLER